MKVSRIYHYLASKFKGKNLTPSSKTDAEFKLFANEGEGDKFCLSKAMEIAQKRFGDRSVSDKELQGLEMEALNRP